MARCGSVTGPHLPRNQERTILSAAARRTDRSFGGCAEETGVALLNPDRCIYNYLPRTLPRYPRFHVCARLSVEPPGHFSHLYDEALRPLGLTVTQFTILQALSLTGEISQGKLGEILAMDSTSLTRTLNIVKRNGWIVIRRGIDRRERRVNLSPAGTAERGVANRCRHLCGLRKGIEAGMPGVLIPRHSNVRSKKLYSQAVFLSGP